ncbi:dnaJ-like protein 60 [Manduca sexta]|nr:dnaJ-like protein 60 [Manduca sexta]KAG6442452.1 hypothetical protein O3G_MSEX002381 [Manduca sexta]
MYLIKRSPDFRTLQTLIRFYGVSRKSHYEVLNLRKNCTDKEIKEAFIKMSKEFHPDKNKDAKAQEKFVQIVEAYNVLGKPSSRAQYDGMREVFTGPSPYVYKPHVHYNFRKNPQYSYYDSTGQSQSAKANAKSYYGVDGIKKLPNYYIILICFGVAFIGVVLQIYVIRNTYVLQQRQAQEKSKYLAEELDRVRSAAQSNGNELQTRLLLEKIVTAANPAVATASLGQALASDKK